MSGGGLCGAQSGYGNETLKPAIWFRVVELNYRSGVSGHEERPIAAELNAPVSVFPRPQQLDFGVKPVGNLLHYAVVFLVVALVAAFLGFGGVSGTAMEGARILFWVAIVLFVVSAVAGWVRRA